MSAVVGLLLLFLASAHTCRLGDAVSLLQRDSAEVQLREGVAEIEGPAAGASAEGSAEMQGVAEHPRLNATERRRKAEKLSAIKEASKKEAAKLREKESRLASTVHRQTLQQTESRRARLVAAPRPAAASAARKAQVSLGRSEDSDGASLEATRQKRQPPRSGSVHLTVVYKSPTGQAKEFGILYSKTSPLRGLLSAAAKRIGVAQDENLMVVHNGRRVRPEDTAQGFQMKDQDVIKMRRIDTRGERERREEEE